MACNSTKRSHELVWVVEDTTETDTLTEVQGWYLSLDSVSTKTKTEKETKGIDCFRRQDQVQNRGRRRDQALRWGLQDAIKINRELSSVKGHQGPLVA